MKTTVIDLLAGVFHSLQEMQIQLDSVFDLAQDEEVGSKATLYHDEMPAAVSTPPDQQRLNQEWLLRYRDMAEPAPVTGTQAYVLRYFSQSGEYRIALSNRISLTEVYFSEAVAADLRDALNNKVFSIGEDIFQWPAAEADSPATESFHYNFHNGLCKVTKDGATIARLVRITDPLTDAEYWDVWLRRDTSDPADWMHWGEWSSFDAAVEEIVKAFDEPAATAATAAQYTWEHSIEGQYHYLFTNGRTTGAYVKRTEDRAGSTRYRAFMEGVPNQIWHGSLEAAQQHLIHLIQLVEKQPEVRPPFATIFTGA